MAVRGVSVVGNHPVDRGMGHVSGGKVKSNLNVYESGVRRDHEKDLFTHADVFVLAPFIQAMLVRDLAEEQNVIDFKQQVQQHFHESIYWENIFIGVLWRDEKTTYSTR